MRMYMPAPPAIVSSFTGMMDFDGEICRLRIQREFLPDGTFDADQDDFHMEGLSGLNRAFHLRLGSMVASHCVDGNRQHVLRSVNLRFCYFNYLAALVFSATRTYAMGQLRFVAIGALRQNGGFQGVVSPARGGSALRVASFGIWHGSWTS